MTSTKKRKKIFKNFNEAFFYILMLAWPVFQFVLFYVFVNANSFVLAFRSFSQENNQWYFSGFANFKEALELIFKDYTLKLSIKNSFSYFFISLFVRTGFSLLFSYYIFKKLPFAKTFRVLVFIPQIVSIVIMVVLYKYFADLLIPEVISRAFKVNTQGLISNLSTSYGTIIFFNLWIGIASSILIYLGSMNNISQEILEAGKIDGANSFQEFIYIIIPGIYQTFVTFVLVSVAEIFIHQLNVFSFFGQDANTRYSNIGYYLYAQLAKNINSPAAFPLLSALGICFTAVAIPLVLVVRKLLYKFGPKEE